MDYDQATREKRRRTSERVGTQIHMREPSDSPTIPFCNPPSPPPETMDTKKWAVLMRGWKTSVTLVGFYISGVCNFNCPLKTPKSLTTLACTLAIVHYTIFAYLDRRVIGSSHDASLRSTDVPQSYVTTTSLVLVTAFRAALAGSIGIAYTQYLWKNLRSSLLSVSIIEELFQIRNNPLRLMNYTLLLSTPTLLVIATFSWVVPTAMIYPPGALVVGLEGRNVPEKFNVSGFQPNDTVSKDSQLGTYNGLAEVRPMCHGGPHTRVCNYTYRYDLADLTTIFFAADSATLAQRDC